MIRFVAIVVLGPLAGRFPGLAYPLAGWVARAGWLLNGSVRRRLTRNLLPATGGNLAAARSAGLAAYQNVLRYYIDLCTLPRRDLATFERDHLQLSGEEHLGALRDEVPIVIVSAHTGNPEMVVQALLARGRQFIALVEPLKPRAYAHRLKKLRSAAGGRYYETDMAGLRSCLAELRAGGLVAMMGDRDLSGTGVCVDLLGQRVRLPRGPWELARRSDALIMPVFCSRGVTDDMTVRIEQPFRVGQGADADRDVAEAAERWASLFERHLRREPGQWTVLEDFWLVHGCG